MNALIANYFVEKIRTLDWAGEDIGGLVRPAVRRVPIKGQPGKFFVQRFPVACDVTWTDCDGNEEILRMYTPDSSKRVVIYFEDNGLKEVKDGNRISYRSYLRLVCWMNTDKFQNAGCALDFYAINAIRATFDTRPVNYNALAQSLRVLNVSIPKKGPEIFAQYTFNEYMQYLLHPYDYFAMDIETEFSVNTTCLPALIAQDNDC